MSTGLTRVYHEGVLELKNDDYGLSSRIPRFSVREDVDVLWIVDMDHTYIRHPTIYHGIHRPELPAATHRKFSSSGPVPVGDAFNRARRSSRARAAAVSCGDG